MKILFKPIAVFALALGMLGTSILTLEGQDKARSLQVKSLFSVIDEDGWKVPLSPADQAISKADRTFENVKVIERNFKLASETESDLELYALRDDGVLVQRSLYVSLRSLSSLEAGGKTFAYHGTYLQVGISDSVGKAYFGAPIDIYYVDSNADGVFETRIYSPGGNLDRLPDWVRTKRIVDDRQR